MSHSERRVPAIGYGLYLTAATLFGFNGTVAKTLLATGIPAARLSQLRVTLAFLLLLLAVLVTNRKALRLKSWAEFRLLAGYGLAGVTLTQFLYFYSIHLIPIGVALIIEFTSPFMVAVWVRIRKGTAIGRRVLAGMLVAFSGLVLIAQPWQGLVLDTLGVLCAWGAAVSLAVYFVLGEATTMPPHSRDPLSITMYGFGFASLLWALVMPWPSFPWHYLQGRSEPWGSAGWRLPLWLLVAFMVVFGTVVTFSLMVASFRHITSAQASSFGMAEPVVASIIAWALIGEALAPWQVAGITIAAFGIMYAERSRSAPVEYIE